MSETKKGKDTNTKLRYTVYIEERENNQSKKKEGMSQKIIQEKKFFLKLLKGKTNMII